MSFPGKADPAIYSKLRNGALERRIPNADPNMIQAVIMDWHVPNGTVTVLAASDGTASIYLSSGGGFIGGSQSAPALRNAAVQAVQLADLKRGDTTPTIDTSLPPAGAISIFLVTGNGLLLAQAPESSLRDGSSPILPLANAMQRIVTGYRLWDEKRRAATQ